MDGGRVPLRNVLGPRKTALLFWDVRSRASREALLHLSLRSRLFEEKEAAFVAVEREGGEAARAFLTEQNVQVTCFGDPGGRLAARLGVGEVLPVTVVVDRRGKIVGSVEGGGGGLEPRLAALLGPSEAPPASGDHETTDAGGRRWLWASAAVGVAVLVLALVAAS